MSLVKLLPTAATWLLAGLLVAVPLSGVRTGGSQQQIADPAFDPAVRSPAYVSQHPKVMIDEAHRNFHTALGRYKPLADLLTSDGYDVSRNFDPFSAQSLQDVGILIIANALGADLTIDHSSPAFTDEEADSLRNWVQNGGSLLLIADHVPFGVAAENVATRFNVEMGKGIVFDLENSDGSPTALVFSRDNATLGDHAILRERNASESIERVVAFSGQSVSIPDGAAALMKFSSSARESPTSSQLEADLTSDGDNARSVAGLAQAIAMRFGRGRLVIAGESSMFSAQVVQLESAGQTEEIRVGFNVPGNDDRQFTLNVLHWLSGLLD